MPILIGEKKRKLFRGLHPGGISNTERIAILLLRSEGWDIKVDDQEWLREPDQFDQTELMRLITMLFPVSTHVRKTPEAFDKPYISDLIRPDKSREFERPYKMDEMIHPERSSDFERTSETDPPFPPFRLEKKESIDFSSVLKKYQSQLDPSMSSSTSDVESDSDLPKEDTDDPGRYKSD